MKETSALENFYQTVSNLMKSGQSIGFVGQTDIKYSDYRKGYLDALTLLNDEELIYVYNQMNGRYFNVILGAQYGSITSEFKRRGIDFSAICNHISEGTPGFSVSFSKTVRLEEKKIVVISDQRKPIDL